jgi:hypothetical protein
VAEKHAGYDPWHKVTIFELHQGRRLGKIENQEKILLVSSQSALN